MRLQILEKGFNSLSNLNIKRESSSEVRVLACHAKSRGFKSRLSRKKTIIMLTWRNR